MSADAIAVSGEFYPDDIDPMLGAMRQFIVDQAGGGIEEFTEGNTMVVPPDTTDQGIDAMIGQAMARAKGLCLLLVGGGGKNPDPSAPGPRMVLAVEAQLYVSTRIRPRGSRSVLELVACLMRELHHAQIRISGFPWYEEIRATGFDPLPDPDFTAYAVTMEREFQL